MLLLSGGFDRAGFRLDLIRTSNFFSSASIGQRSVLCSRNYLQLSSSVPDLPQNNAEVARTLLTQEQDKQEDMPEITNDIIQDAKRAGDVVSKLRRLVKKGDEPFEPLSINALIDDVLALSHGSLTENKVTLRLDLKPDLPNISGDRVRLPQVLLNLVTNALDAMKETPSRILTVRSAMDAPHMITVSVGDSGPGIVEARRALVFQPFFTTKKDGLGLGLSICRSIIEEHGGRIWQDDNPGGGAAFSFSLKACR